MLVGRDWREDQWQRITRILGFSVLGLAAYSLLVGVTSLPAVAYLHPETLARSLSAPTTQVKLFTALVGHFIFSALAGLVAGASIRGLGRMTRFSVYSGAWDRFAYFCAPGRWVVVALKGGESFAGIIEAADTSVGSGERDLILEEPAQYDSESSQYVSMKYQFLYIPGDFVATVGAVADPDIDNGRITELGTAIFQGEGKHGERIPATEVSASSQ